MRPTRYRRIFGNRFSVRSKIDRARGVKIKKPRQQFRLTTILQKCECLHAITNLEQQYQRGQSLYARRANHIAPSEKSHWKLAIRTFDLHTTYECSGISGPEITAKSARPILSGPLATLNFFSHFQRVDRHFRDRING